MRLASPPKADLTSAVGSLSPPLHHARLRPLGYLLPVSPNQETPSRPLFQPIRDMVEPLFDPKDIQVSVLARGIDTAVCLRCGLSDDDPSPCFERKHSWVQAVSDLMPLGDIASMICTSDDLFRRTERLRALLQSGRTSGSPYTRAKRQLPALVPALAAPPGTSLKGVDVGKHHSGLFGYDLDLGRGSLDLPAMREALMDARGAVMVATSAGGDALYAVFAGPKAESERAYKAHWHAIADTFPEVAKAASAGQSKNSNRLRFVVHDPTAWLAGTPVERLVGAHISALPKGRRRQRPGHPHRCRDRPSPSPEEAPGPASVHVHEMEAMPASTMPTLCEPRLPSGLLDRAKVVKEEERWDLREGVRQWSKRT